MIESEADEAGFKVSTAGMRKHPAGYLKVPQLNATLNHTNPAPRARH